MLRDWAEVYQRPTVRFAPEALGACLASNDLDGHLRRHRITVRNAQNGLVPMNLAGWLGRAPTHSDHVLFHREYLRLEGMGLIQRVSLTGGRRTTHLRLTPAGRRLAEGLLAEEYGPEADEGIDWANVEFEPIELPVDASEGGGSEDG